MGHFYGFYDVFLRSKYRMRIFFGVAKYSNIFWICLIIHNSKIMIKSLERGMQVNWYCYCCVLGLKPRN